MKKIDNLFDNNGHLVPFDDLADEYYSFHKPAWANYFDQANNTLTNLAITKNGNQELFINELLNKWESIIKAIPSQIPSLISEFTTGVFHNTLNNATFRKEIEDAFNYSAFRKSAKASWFAERFEIKACLYCNAQFTLAIGKEGRKKKLLFQLDHFYNKSKFPFLSLTFGNLIPSCSTCNNSKSNKDFSIQTHIHPYYEDTNIKFDFYIDEDNALEYMIGNRDYKLLKPKIKITDPKFDSHNVTFGIESIYEKHTDIVEEIILKSLYYNKTKRDELNREFSELNLSTSLIDRFVLGNYSLDSEINKRPLAKLSRDIGKQLKIIE